MNHLHTRHIIAARLTAANAAIAIAHIAKGGPHYKWYIDTARSLIRQASFARRFSGNRALYIGTGYR